MPNRQYASSINYRRRAKDGNPFSTVPPIILLGSALVSGAVLFVTFSIVMAGGAA